MNYYPTRYSGLTDSGVNDLYRSDTWSNLERSERLDAIQELANRSAQICGNRPCEVKLEKMNGSTYGYYQNGGIFINESLVESGELSVEFDDGTSMSYAVPGANAQIMNTIHHENYHAYQNDVVNGHTNHNNSAETELWRANWNNNNYIRYDENPLLYRLQSIERSAFDYGDTRTKSAFDRIEALYGADSGYQNYYNSYGDKGYTNALSKASKTYGQNIEEMLAESMLQNYRSGYSYDYAAFNFGLSDNSYSAEEDDYYDGLFL